MKAYEVWGIFDLTARRIHDAYYPFLKLNPKRVSESDARHVMAKVLEERGLIYALEVKTKEIYPRFGAGEERRALVDLVAYETQNELETPIWIEFKRGLLGEPMIKKDFVKMMIETNVDLTCFFHVLPAPEKKRSKRKNGPIEAIFGKYLSAYGSAIKALKASSDYRSCKSKRFCLFVYDLENNRSYFVFKPDLCSIDSFEIPRTEIVWGESDGLHRGFGHGVEFLYRGVKDSSEGSLIAIIRGYEWLHHPLASPVTVEILPPTSDAFKKYSTSACKIIEEIKYAALSFFESKIKEGNITENVSTHLNG